MAVILPLTVMRLTSPFVIAGIIVFPPNPGVVCVTVKVSFVCVTVLRVTVSLLEVCPAAASIASLNLAAKPPWVESEAMFTRI